MTKFRKSPILRGSPYAALALLRMADQKWQEGQIDDAKKLYQELLTKHGGDRMFQLAEQRLKQIKITPPVLIDYVPEPTPAPGTPGAAPAGLPETNLAPPSAAALDKAISTPGLLGDEPAPAGTSLTPDAPPAKEDSLLPPPVLPAPAK